MKSFDKKDSLMKKRETSKKKKKKKKKKFKTLNKRKNFSSIGQMD